MKFIIIDDEEGIRLLLKTKLEKEFVGCTTIPCKDFIEGRDEIFKFNPISDDAFETYYLLDGDLGGKENGLDLLIYMTKQQINQTIFISFNPVLVKQAQLKGIMCWNKMDIINGIKLKMRNSNV